MTGRRAFSEVQDYRAMSTKGGEPCPDPYTGKQEPSQVGESLPSVCQGIVDTFMTLVV